MLLVCVGGNLMDWSKKDFLTVAFPNAVYLWDRKKHLTTQCDVSNTTCIKWNKEGTLLFTAFSNGLFEVNSCFPPLAICLAIGFVLE